MSWTPKVSDQEFSALVKELHRLHMESRRIEGPTLPEIAIAVVEAGWRPATSSPTQVRVWHDGYYTDADSVALKVEQLVNEGWVILDVVSETVHNGSRLSILAAHNWRECPSWEE